MKKLLLLLLLIPALLGAEEDRKPTKKEWQKAKKVLESNLKKKYWKWDGKVEVDRLNNTKKIKFYNVENKGCIFYYSMTLSESGKIYEGPIIFFNKENQVQLIPAPKEKKIISIIKIRTDKTKIFEWAIVSTGDGHNYYFLIGSPKAAGGKDIRSIILNSQFIALSYKTPDGQEYRLEFNNEGTLSELRDAAEIYLTYS